MTERLEILRFLIGAATEMAQLAGRDGVPAHVAAEMERIAIELDAEAAQLHAELRLESLTTRVANTNRRGLAGLSD
jgi:hypothetical protein